MNEQRYPAKGKELILTCFKVLLSTALLLTTLVGCAGIIQKVSPNGNLYSAPQGIEYHLYDSVEPITDWIKDPKRVEKLKQYYKEISQCPSYIFYEKIVQPVDVAYFEGAEAFSPEPDRPNVFLYNQAKYSTVSQVMVNQDAFRQAGLTSKILDGKAFSVESFAVTGPYEIPVILGSEYHGVFRVGDALPALGYYDTEISLFVIGFLEKGATIDKNNERILLDRTILSVAPNFNFAPKSEGETQYQGLLYFQKLNGTFQLKEESKNGDIANALCYLDLCANENALFAMQLQGYAPLSALLLRWYARTGVGVFLLIALLATLCYGYLCHKGEQRMSSKPAKAVGRALRRQAYSMLPIATILCAMVLWVMKDYASKLFWCALASACISFVLVQFCVPMFLRYMAKRKIQKKNSSLHTL